MRLGTNNPYLLLAFQLQFESSLASLFSSFLSSCIKFGIFAVDCLIRGHDLHEAGVGSSVELLGQLLFPNTSSVRFSQ